MARVDELAASLSDGLGAELRGFMQELHPICRSITGPGLRQTLDRIGDWLPLTRRRIGSGSEVLDWTVPPEWTIRDAYVADAHGRRVIDFAANNLHVVNYSIPVRRRMSLEELRPHLHSLPDHPDWIPYRTSYYRESWGFCLSHRALEALAPGEYEVVIDSSLEPGHLDYGELHLPGESGDTVLLSTHVCHPSMCNDNLSGIAVLAAVGRALSTADRRLSYRLIFAPGTIGAICWLAENREFLPLVRHGLVLAGLGDRGALCYKRSRRGDSEIDRVVANWLADTESEHRLVPFSPYGYDERQYNSPGFDLAVGRLSRTEYATYPEYHTSADDFDFVSDASLRDSVAQILGILGTLDSNRRYVNLQPYGEPQLGRRGLYDAAAAGADWERVRLGLLWVLNLSDGDHSLLDIAERSGLPYAAIREAARRLEAAQLLAPTD